MDKDALKDWLNTVISALVIKKDKIDIEYSVDEQGVLYTVKVDPTDVGKVIGKGGEIANAIRTLLRSAGFSGEIRASMKVEAPGSNFSPRDNNRRRS